MMHGLRVFDALEPKFTPLQVCSVCGVDHLNWQLRGVFTPEKLVLCISLVTPSSDTGTTHRGSGLGSSKDPIFNVI